MNKIYTIGIDIDNTITADDNSIKFFRMFTMMLCQAARIILISNRDTDEESYKSTCREMIDMGIRYDKIIISADKVGVVEQEQVDVYFDDTDEYFINMPPKVLVFKIREAGNFDFEEHKWLYGDKTGRKLSKD